MPRYRVLKSKRFGEGWAAGDIIDMDLIAARVPLEEGALEPVGSTEEKTDTNTLTKEGRMFENLKEAKMILDSIGVTFWLEAGTCLGAVREGTFIEHDPDIDLGVLAEDEDKADVIIDQFEKLGFELIYVWGERGEGYELSFMKRDYKLDIFFFYKAGKFRWHGAYWQNQLIPHVFTAGTIERLKKIDFMGLEVNIPYNHNKYLKARYGEDWKTPDKDWKYWKDPKCIQMDFNV